MTSAPTPEVAYTPPSDGWSDQEDEEDAQLARALRRKDRRERKRAGKAGIRANRALRRSQQRHDARDRREHRYHRRALAARRKVTNPDRKLTAAWRAYSGFAAAAGAVALAALVWMSIAVGRALQMGFAGYMVEALFSVLLLVSVGTQVYATRHNHTVPKWQYVLDTFLLGSSLALNIVPWGTNTNWAELAALPAHALPPIALVCAVLMQYVLSNVFGEILNDAYADSAETADREPALPDHARPWSEATAAKPDHQPDHGQAEPDHDDTDGQDLLDHPDHDTGTSPTAPSDSAPNEAVEAPWSGAIPPRADHGRALPDHDDTDGQDLPDHPDHTPDHDAPSPANAQVSRWSGQSDHGRSSSSPTTQESATTHPMVGQQNSAPQASTPGWSGVGTTAPHLVEQPTTEVPTIPAELANNDDELVTKGLSHEAIAELLVPVVENLIAEDDFLSRTDVTTITDINSSTTASQVLQHLKQRYPDHPEPKGRRKPERTRTIAHALATLTGQPHLQSVR